MLWCRWAYQHVPDMAIARELKNAESKMAQWGPKQIDAMFERTKRYFGIFQIELKAVAIVDNLLTEEMGQYGGQADSYAFPNFSAMTDSSHVKLPDPVRSGSLRHGHQPLLHHFHHGW